MFWIHLKRFETRLDLSSSVFIVYGSHASQSFLIAKKFHQQGTSGLLPTPPCCCTSELLSFFHISLKHWSFANCSVSPLKEDICLGSACCIGWDIAKWSTSHPGQLWFVFGHTDVWKDTHDGTSLDQLLLSSPLLLHWLQCSSTSPNSAVWFSPFKYNTLSSIA